MTFDHAAYMRAYRKQRSAAGKCPNCGLPMPPSKTVSKCKSCRAVDYAKEKINRRFMHLGKAVAPQLKESVATGQPVFLSPADSLKLVKILDLPGAT